MPPRNAYFLYMIDFQKDQEAKLGRKLSMAEVSELAAASWNALDDEKRGWYRARAKGGKNTTENRTSQGIAFSEVDRVLNVKKNEEEKMIERIHELLNHFTVPVGICTYPFFVMSGNYFYRKHNKFVPAELALVKFTFRSGIQERYHAYLNPGSVELGYAADAKNHSENTHKLPVPPNAMGETNFNNVFRKISKLLKADDVHKFDSGKPFVFTCTGDYTTEEDNIRMLKSFMTQMSNEESPIDIYPISRLFFILATMLNEIDRHQKIENITIAQILLSRDPYEHRSGFSCKFHEEIDSCAHCALSKATRWTYLMSKHLCEPLGINLVSGKHLPMDPDVVLLHQSMQSLYESDTEGSICDSETYSEQSFDDESSLGASGSGSTLGKSYFQNRLSAGPSKSSVATSCDDETNSEHSIDEDIRAARDVSDTSSCVSKNSRRQLLNKLLLRCDKDGSSSFNDSASSIDSASVFDEDASVKSSRYTQNSRRRMIQQLMKKGDQESTISLSQLSLDN